MKILNACLCPGCIVMLRPWLDIEPNGSADGKNTCDWCERVQTDSRVRILINTDK
jgi:hypothetical protein